MDDVSAGAFQRLKLCRIDMNAMRKRDVLSGQTKRIEIGDVAHSSLALDQIALGLVFRSMAVNHHAELACQPRNLTQQVAGAANCEARCKAIPNAPICSAMPGFQQIERFSN